MLGRNALEHKSTPRLRLAAVLAVPDAHRLTLDGELSAELAEVL